MNVKAVIKQIGLFLNTIFKDDINTNFDNLAQKDYDNYNELNSRIDTIITTPIDGAGAAQELIDARKGEATLRAKVDSMDTASVESTGYGVITGLTVSAQATPNMTVNVATGTVHMPDGKRFTPIAIAALAINAAVATIRKDIVHVNLSGVISYLAGIAAVLGNRTYTITANAVGAIAGSRTYPITTNAVAGDTVTINGVTFTAVASGATGNQFNVGADATATAVNLTTSLNANATINALYTATSSTNTITLTEKTAGGGNTPSAATKTGTIVIGAGTVTTSKAADTVVINGITFTAVASGATGNQFNVGADTTITATNLTSVLNANTTINANYSATSSTNIITLTQKTTSDGVYTPTAATVTGTVAITSSAGTTSVQAVAPATPAGGLLLSEIKVGANVTTITSADITDKRTIKTSLPSHLADVAAHGYLFRQALINGNFDVWQRGTLFDNVNLIYTVDRWKIANAVDTNVKILQSSIVPDVKSKYSLRAEVMTAVGGAGAYSDIYQLVEDYSFFAGKTVTFSGYVKCDAGASFVPRIEDGIGVYTGSSISNTAWVFLSLTATINTAPSRLVLYAQFNRGGLAIGNGINLAQLQLCVGDKALPFSPRSFADELRLCQRYYEKSYDIDVVPGSNNSNSAYDGAIGAGSSGRVFINFKVPKRISPTMKYYTLGGTVDQWESITSADVVTLRSLAFATIGKNGVAVSLVSSGTDGRCRGHWIADAEL